MHILRLAFVAITSCTFLFAGACSDDETARKAPAQGGTGGGGRGGSGGKSATGGTGGTSQGGSAGQTADAGAGGFDDSMGGSAGSQGGNAGSESGGGGEPQGGSGGAGGDPAGGSGGAEECDAALGPLRVSITSAGVEVSGASTAPSISGDGRVVAFVSQSTELVSGSDTNNATDIFTHDRMTGLTERVSVANDSSGANAASYSVAISGNGRWIAFDSFATNLAVTDADAFRDVYVHDRQSLETTIVSLGSRTPALDGPDVTQPAISADGMRVAFVGSNLTNAAVFAANVYVFDRNAMTTTLASVTPGNVASNENCSDPALSADGNLVVFVTQSAGFLPAPPLLAQQIFMKNLQTGELVLVSQNAAGERGADTSSLPSVSADGRFVAFVSHASNLVMNDSNGVPDIFVRDLQTSTTTRVSVDSAGVQGNAPGTLTRPSISDDGRYVVFASDSSNLSAGDSPDYRDAFVHDRLTGTTRKLSANALGTAADRSTTSIVLSADGSTVAFDTNATNLISDDLLGYFDVFVLDNCVP